MQRWCLRVSLRVISYRAPCNDARLYHTRRIVQSQPAAAPYKTQPAAAPYPANEIRSIRPYVAPIRPSAPISYGRIEAHSMRLFYSPLRRPDSPPAPPYRKGAYGMM